MTSPDSYTPPSFRGAAFMLVLILAGVVLAWLAYSAALNTGFGRGVEDPGGSPATTVQPSAP